MPILATISQNPNLFTSAPSNPPFNDYNCKKSPPPPIPIPKYPPKKPKTPPNPNPALKSFHHRSKYYKPIPSDGVIATDGTERSIVLGENGLSYLLPGAPFEFQFSYSETPKVKPLAMREPGFLPFAPPTMPRPWTGKAPLKKKKDKKVPLFESLNSPSAVADGVKKMEIPRPMVLGRYPKEWKTREEILGEPLKRAEVKMLVKPYLSSNRQVNLGRDGLTHNMLELIHAHWRRQPICKVRCRGVPTVDMDNVCHHLEEKTRGKIIHRAGGIVYLFRGRNYDHRTRPVYPIMLWKPAAPVYPKLIQDAPEGLTKIEADEFRRKGQNLLSICKLAKNGIYINLVKDVRDAFEGSPLVKIDCKGLDASDYKKIGAKLKELVPCVLLSFDQEQILMWRGKDWRSKYGQALPPVRVNYPSYNGISSSSVASDCSNPNSSDQDNATSSALGDISQRVNLGQSGDADTKTPISSPKTILCWKRAIESRKALLLDEIDLSPDALLDKVEDFEGISQAMEHSYPALILPSGHNASISNTKYGGDGSGVETDDNDSEDDNYSDDGVFVNDSFEEVESSIPLGSLPVDSLSNPRIFD